MIPQEPPAAPRAQNPLLVAATIALPLALAVGLAAVAVDPVLLRHVVGGTSAVAAAAEPDGTPAPDARVKTVAKPVTAKPAAKRAAKPAARKAQPKKPATHRTVTRTASRSTSRTTFRSTARTAAASRAAHRRLVVRRLRRHHHCPRF